MSTSIEACGSALGRALSCSLTCLRPVRVLPPVVMSASSAARVGPGVFLAPGSPAKAFVLLSRISWAAAPATSATCSAPLTVCWKRAALATRLHRLPLSAESSAVPRLFGERAVVGVAAAAAVARPTARARPDGSRCRDSADKPSRVGAENRRLTSSLRSSAERGRALAIPPREWRRPRRAPNGCRPARRSKLANVNNQQRPVAKPGTNQSTQTRSLRSRSRIDWAVEAARRVTDFSFLDSRCKSKDAHGLEIAQFQFLISRFKILVSKRPLHIPNPPVPHFSFLVSGFKGSLLSWDLRRAEHISRFRFLDSRCTDCRELSVGRKQDVSRGYISDYKWN
eukprot:scaffold57378_cov61-Phaeocystis_antarctica.AAC.3